MSVEKTEIETYFGRCRCCLSYGYLKNMWAEHDFEGETEIYGEMLVQCFALSWDQSEDAMDQDQICEQCICRLRDASDFKKVVLDSQEELLHKFNTENEVTVKEEAFEVQYLEEDIGDTTYADTEYTADTTYADTEYTADTADTVGSTKDETEYQEIEYLEDDNLEDIKDIADTDSSQPSEAQTSGRKSKRLTNQEDDEAPKRKWPKKLPKAQRLKTYRQYSEETFRKCMEVVRNGEMTPQEAAEKYKIPKKTICAKLKMDPKDVQIDNTTKSTCEWNLAPHSTNLQKKPNILRRTSLNETTKKLIEEHKLKAKLHTNKKSCSKIVEDVIHTESNLNTIVMNNTELKEEVLEPPVNSKQVRVPYEPNTLHRNKETSSTVVTDVISTESYLNTINMKNVDIKVEVIEPPVQVKQMRAPEEAIALNRNKKVSSTIFTDFISTESNLNTIDMKSIDIKIEEIEAPVKANQVRAPDETIELEKASSTIETNVISTEINLNTIDMKNINHEEVIALPVDTMQVRVPGEAIALHRNKKASSTIVTDIITESNLNTMELMNIDFEEAIEAPIKTKQVRGRYKADANKKSKNKLKKPTRSDHGEMFKHKHNIKTILENTNATVIKGFSGVRFACNFCEEQKKLPCELKQHNLEAHSNEGNEVIKVKHVADLVIRLDITNLKCQLCEKCLNTLEDLTDHLTNVHTKLMYKDIKNHIMPFIFDPSMESPQCAICKKEFQFFKVLSEHMSEHYRNYECPSCGRAFVNKEALRHHSARHKKGTFKCAQCPKVFECLPRRSAHERRVHKLSHKMQKCSFCDEEFRTKYRVNSHEAEVHGVRSTREPKVFVCQACNKPYSCQSSLITHKNRYHLLRRPHQCSVCDKEFFSKIELQSHSVTHTKTREHKCQICNKLFGTQCGLIRHVKGHSSDRKYKCDSCKRSFANRTNYKIHMRTQHGIIV